MVSLMVMVLFRTCLITVHTAPSSCLRVTASMLMGAILRSDHICLMKAASSSCNIPGLGCSVKYSFAGSSEAASFASELLHPAVCWMAHAASLIVMFSATEHLAEPPPPLPPLSPALVPPIQCWLPSTAAMMHSLRSLASEEG